MKTVVFKKFLTQFQFLQTLMDQRLLELDNIDIWEYQI